MADFVDEAGWLWLSNGGDYLKLACERIRGRRVENPKVKHLSGDGHYGYDLRKRWTIISAMNVIFENETNMENTIKYLEEWNVDGGITLEIIKNTSDDKLKHDGVNESVTVMCVNIQNWEKVAPANGRACLIQLLLFEQIS